MQNSGNLDLAGDAEKTPPAPASGPPRSTGPFGWRRITVLGTLTAVLALCFIRPLCDWMGFAMHSQFYSYMPLMPVITGYLIWLRRAGLGADIRPGWGAAAAAAAAGGAILAIYFQALQRDGFRPGKMNCA